MKTTISPIVPPSMNLDMSESFKVQISGHKATIYASSYQKLDEKLPSKVFQANLKDKPIKN